MHAGMHPELAALPAVPRLTGFSHPSAPAGRPRDRQGRRREGREEGPRQGRQEEVERRPLACWLSDSGFGEGSQFCKLGTRGALIIHRLA